MDMSKCNIWGGSALILFFFSSLLSLYLKYNPENKNPIGLASVSFLSSSGRQKQELTISLELDTVGEREVPRRMSDFPKNKQANRSSKCLPRNSYPFFSQRMTVSYSVKRPPSTNSAGFCTHPLAQWKISP